VVATAIEALTLPASHPAFLGLRDVYFTPESSLLPLVKNAFDRTDSIKNCGPMATSSCFSFNEGLKGGDRHSGLWFF
jgi:hypothetical protein